MGNKPIGTQSDPLVIVQHKILRSQKEFLGKQGNASAYVRKLISTQMSDPEVGIDKEREAVGELEAIINVKKAKIADHDKAKALKRMATAGREEAIKEIASKLKGLLGHDFKGNPVFSRELQDYIKHNVINKNLELFGNDNGSENQIQDQEVWDKIVQMVGHVVRKGIS